MLRGNNAHKLMHMRAANDSSSNLHPALTLVVETADGMIIRDVPNASLLPDDEERGPAAENATRDSAARWGLPDFVFLPEQQRKGAGVRERGDGLIIADGIAALIQVKARNAETGTPEREQSWLKSNITKAIKQAKGSIRHLAHRREKLTSARGRRVEIDGALFDWIAVVIVDHPNPPEFTPDLTEAGNIPCVVLLRRDWEFLFEHMRSTLAVLHYLTRVAGEEYKLGGEPERYMQAALADSEASARPLPTALQRLAGPTESAPIYSVPRAPLTPTDEGGLLFRIIMEDVAISHIGEHPENARLELLTALDTLPPAYRPELSRVLMKFMASVARYKDNTVHSESRVFVPFPGDQRPMLFMVASQHAHKSSPLLSIRTQLLHHEYWGALDGASGSTVGVMLTPTQIKGRQWDTSTIWLKGNFELTEEEAEEYRQTITGRI